MTADEGRRIFGENILALINQRHWTLQKAADELRYNRQDLSSVTVGKKNFRLATAVRFARYFNVSVFLLFSRQFDNRIYRGRFAFVDTDYMAVFRKNFQNTSVRRASVPLDPTTTSHILNGRRNNVTIDTLGQFAIANCISVSELLKTDQDKLLEKCLMEDME